MHPDLFSLGPVTIHTYGLFLATGFFAGLLVATRLGRYQGIDPQKIMDMGFIMIIAGLIGSRLMYCIINISYFIENPIDIIKIWEGGLVFSGGLVGIAPAMAWYTRRHHLPLWRMGDIWAPAAAIGQGIGRIGCLMAGCCYGRPTGTKWGVVFTNPESLAPLNIPLHPTQIYSSISGFIIFIILFRLYKNRKFDGQVFLWFLILHSTARLAIERFRGDDRGMFFGTDMTTTQFVALLILIGSVITLFIRKSGTKKADHPPQ